MFTSDDYHTVYGSEGCGSTGSIGIRIQVASSKLKDPHQIKAVWDVAYDLGRKLEDELIAAVKAVDPEAQKHRVAERAQIVGLFDQPIYVEEIPNGYCSSGCCRHLPWFRVTTTKGRITLGWRKRVIEIKWDEVPGSKTAAELFASEDVTKGERLIHAWTVEKARAYIAAILSSVPTS